MHNILDVTAAGVTKRSKELCEVQMGPKTVDVQEAKINLEELLSKTFEGAEIILTQDDVPLARLVPIASPLTPRIAGLHSGSIWTSQDFDEPLPDDFWAGTNETAL